ncbi:hypothetical protein L3V83_14110 [Thiotrichales bacterium 19X7-9]|nr:hypothetical protein [Thiotrichales bacterium 19X7-9]
MSKLLPHQTDHFLKLHRSLLSFTNNKYNIHPELKSADDFQNLDAEIMEKAIPAIRKKMYETSNIKNFCDKNPYDLKEKDLAIIHQWKDKLIIEGYLVKHLRNYSVIMASPNQDNKLYGIKGISNGLDEYLPSNCLPYRAKFILLPFLDYIVYDGFISGYNIHFGSNMRQDINNEYNQIKALDGIYSKYTIGDDLSNPPKTASVKDMVKYSIKQSLERGQFPNQALEYAEQNNERVIFEKEYTAKYIQNDKKNLKTNDELPKMHYGAYRETIIAVQPSKKELLEFCKKHYPKLVDYITTFSV